MTSASMGTAWTAVVASSAWVAVTTNAPAAWFACALAIGLSALTCMVMAHAPAKSVAQIIRDAEAGGV
jgi:hypothetical protein